MGRPDLEEYKAARKVPLVVVLDNVRSAMNVGSVFRTSDAFSIKEILLCGITACPPNKEINKSALGATESVSWRHCPDTREAVMQLQSEGYKVYAVEQVENAIMLDDYDRADKQIAVVFGNEVDGVSQDVVDICDGCLEIPQTGTKHSLNISVAAGIVLWALTRTEKA